MTLLALGINHQTAPIALRERVAFAPEALGAALDSLRAEPGIGQACILSTCNRTELYCVLEVEAWRRPLDWLHRHHHLRGGQLEEFAYHHSDSAAVRHLFRVATGLDSLVLGEPQVLGQVKQAWQAARGHGALGTALDRLFQASFQVAKRVRTDTEIGANPVSVAFAAVRLARQIFAELDQATVLLIGAGDTIELTARHLHQQGCRKLIVANRSVDRAHELAARFAGYAISLVELAHHLPEADIVISSTASAAPILARRQVEAALMRRRHRPMFMVDIAVPRDIDPAVAELEDVYLYTVDDLHQVIEDNIGSRREAARQAEAIIDLQVEHFMGWWRSLDAHSLIRDLRSRAEQHGEDALQRAQRLLRSGRDPEEVLRFLTHTLTNKLLHGPSAQLRDAAINGDSELLESAQRLFELGNTGGDTPG